MFSRRSMRQAAISLLTVALILTACNVGAEPAPTLDVNAMRTALVGTTVAQLSVQFTQTALAVPTNTVAPTNTIAALPSPTIAGVASPTLDANALPTFSFVNTPATGLNTPAAGFTQVSVLPTSAGQATAPLGDACNNLVFEGDVTIPDGETLEPGADFQKVWAIRNTGTCTWDEGYSFVYIAGSTPNLDPYTFEFRNSDDFVAPGEGINLGINLTTPCIPGNYEGHWRMRNDQGFYFGTILSVYVKVVDDC